METIISINTDGRSSYMIRTLNYIAQKHPMVALIQDPPSLDNKISETISLLGYQTARSDNGDNMLLIRQDMVRDNLITHQSKISLGTIITIGLNKYLIISIYIRPRTDFTSLERALDHIKDDAKTHGQSLVIISGDVNATDPDWANVEETAPELCSSTRSTNQLGIKHYNQIKRARGRQLSSLFRELKLTCLNDPRNNQGTYVSRRNTSTLINIDVTYAGNRALRRWNSITLENIYTQHSLICIRSKQTQDSTSHTKTTYRLSKLRQEHFQALAIEFSKLETNLRQLSLEKLKDRADQMTDLIISHLLQAQEAVATQVRADKGSTQTSCALTRHKIHKLTNQLSAHEKKIKRTRRPLTARDKSALANIRRKVNKTKSKILSMIQQKLIPSEELEDPDLWTRVNSLRNNLHNKGDPNAMTIEKLEDIASEKFGQADSSDSLPDISQSSNQEDWLDISKHETAEALKMVRNKSFTGPEGLKYQTLIKAAEWIEPILHTWCNTCLRAAHTPARCKITNGIIIPKKQKDKFRIVHVGSPMTSLLERIALSRFEFTLESKRLLSDRQYGFTANIDRHDLVTRIIELTLRNSLRENSSQDMRFTTIVSFDIKGAFDNVDQGIIQEKLMQRLAPSPERTWLANFVHNRRITLKHELLRSRPRIIRKGVPQGSILGPVLWNFTINNLDQGISSADGSVELLAYADDLILIYLGNDVSQLQNKVDTLNEQVKALRLEIEPDKCSITRMRYDRRRRQLSPNLALTPTILINGQCITKTSSVSILGVPITHQLRLDLDSSQKKLSLKGAANFLNTVKRFNVVHSPSDWRILLNSYLVSTMVTNNLPVLAIDKDARKWCDKLMERALKHIFDWPSNSSNKVSRLISGMHANTEALTAKAMQINSARPNSEGYKLLHLLMSNNGDIDQLKSLNSSNLDELTRINKVSISAHGRRYHNPQLNSLSKLMEYEDWDQLCRSSGPCWLAIEGGKMAMAAELLNDSTLQIIHGRHTEFATSYFNLMGTISNMASDSSISNRNLAFPPTSSLLQALRNMANRDSRVIELREKLALNKWRICLINKAAYLQIKAKLKLEATVSPHNTPLKWLSWPPTDDYSAINLAKRNFVTTCQQLASEHNTSITRLLVRHNELGTWLDHLNPSWTSGKTTLMLSGLISCHGNLCKGTLADLETPKGCTEDTCARTTLDQPLTNQHTTLHRAFHCHKFKDNRKELRKIINWAIIEELRQRKGHRGDAKCSFLEPWRYSGVIEITLANKRFAQTLVRILTDVAMSNQ